MKRDLASIVFAAVLAAPSAVFADGQKVQVEVDAQFEPASSIGLILSPETTIEKAVSSVKETALHTKIVTFPYSDADIGDNSVATALLVSPDGEIAVGNVRPLSFDEDSEDLMLPVCKEPAQAATLNMEQHGVLQTLIEYRTTRRKLTRLKVVRAMDDQELEKLNRIEERLGLARSEALTPDLNPVVLIDRLTRITEALRAAKYARDEKLPKVEAPAMEPQEASADAQPVDDAKAHSIDPTGEQNDQSSDTSDE
jgi:hypothetical protein